MSTPQNQSPRDTRTEAPESTMSGDTARQSVPRPAPSYEDTTYEDTTAARPEPRGAVLGWTMTAAVLMMLSGAWNFFEGLAAVIKGSFFVVLPNYAFELSARGWGWFHLILGAVVFVAGACLLTDMLWARIVGVAIASISTIVNFLYIPYQPVWSAVIIAIDLVILWALLTPRRRYA